MRTPRILPFTSLLLLLTVEALPSQGPEPPYSLRPGNGVTPPKLIYKAEPEYSEEALSAGVQGTVIFETVINEAGRAVNLSVLSPLGFGLDENAQRAIEKWRFEPGRREGRPVKVAATVEVHFRLVGRLFDGKAEERRTRFNLALRFLKEQSGERRDKAIKTIEDLAERKFAPAMYALGKLLRAGDGVVRDSERAELLIRKAADKDYGPALFDIGLEYYESNQESKDVEKGMRMIRDAAVRGSYYAQVYLGNRYEHGSDAPRDADRARHYFRLCAAKGHADCQVRLANLLLQLPDRKEREYLQAIAWLQVAADQGEPKARDMAEKESRHLTPEQISWVKRLKPQLARSR